MNLKYIITFIAILCFCSDGYTQKLNSEPVNFYFQPGNLRLHESEKQSSGMFGVSLLNKSNLIDRNISKLSENSTGINSPEEGSRQHSEDPENELSGSLTAGYLKEIEENFNTATIYQNYKLSKKFSDKFRLSLNSRIEYAERESNDGEKIKKWFDNTYLKPQYSFNEFNTLSVFAGASISDSVLTTYGFTYDAKIENQNFEIKNSLTMSYDYFYYWNQIGQNFVNDNIEFNYNDFKVSTGIYYGVVDFNYIEGYDYKAKNPNTLFSFEVQYKLLYDPVLNAGVSFSTRDFKYHSPLYYSPSERKLTGVFANLYETAGKFFFYLSAGARVDNENNFIWDTDTEAGYDNNGFSASLGFGRYDDPYYTNYNAFLNLTKIF